MSVTEHINPVRPQEKFYRICLYSTNAISVGSNGQDCTFQIDIPESLPLDAQTQWQYAPEYFVSNTSITSVTGILVNITNLTQPNTYSTMTKGPNFTVLGLRGLPLYQRYINFNSIGYPIANINFMRGGR